MPSMVSPPMSRSRFPCRTARGSPRRPGTGGWESSAACRSSARPASSIPFPLGLDSLHPSRHRRRAGGRSSRVIAANRLGQRRRGAAAASRPAGHPSCLDKGDFAGGVLKYLRRHPVPALDAGRGLRQAHQAGAGIARPPFRPLPGDFAFLAELAGSRAGARHPRRQHGEGGAGPRPRRRRRSCRGGRVGGPWRRSADAGQAPVAPNVLVVDRAGAVRRPVPEGPLRASSGRHG